MSDDFYLASSEDLPRQESDPRPHRGAGDSGERASAGEDQRTAEALSASKKAPLGSGPPPLSPKATPAIKTQPPQLSSTPVPPPLQTPGRAPALPRGSVPAEAEDTETTQDQRIAHSTRGGGFDTLPVAYSRGEDWKTVRSADPFERLYLDASSVDLVSDTMVRKHASQIERFWAAQIDRATGDEQERQKILRKYAGGSLDRLRAYVDDVRQAAQSLATDAQRRDVAQRQLSEAHEAALARWLPFVDLATTSPSVSAQATAHLMVQAEAAGLDHREAADLLLKRLRDEGYRLAAQVPPGTSEAALVHYDWTREPPQGASDPLVAIRDRVKHLASEENLRRVLGGFWSKAKEAAFQGGVALVLRNGRSLMPSDADEILLRAKQARLSEAEASLLLVSYLEKQGYLPMQLPPEGASARDMLRVPWSQPTQPLSWNQVPDPALVLGDTIRRILADGELTPDETHAYFEYARHQSIPEEQAAAFLIEQLGLNVGRFVPASEILPGSHPLHGNRWITPEVKAREEAQRRAQEHVTEHQLQTEAQRWTGREAAHRRHEPDQGLAQRTQEGAAEWQEQTLAGRTSDLPPLVKTGSGPPSLAPKREREATSPVHGPDADPAPGDGTTQSETSALRTLPAEALDSSDSSKQTLPVGAEHDPRGMSSGTGTAQSEPRNSEQASVPDNPSAAPDSANSLPNEADASGRLSKSKLWGGLGVVALLTATGLWIAVSSGTPEQPSRGVELAAAAVPDTLTPIRAREVEPPSDPGEAFEPQGDSAIPSGMPSSPAPPPDGEPAPSSHPRSDPPSTREVDRSHMYSEREVDRAARPRGPLRAVSTEASRGETVRVRVFVDHTGRVERIGDCQGSVPGCALATSVVLGAHFAPALLQGTPVRSSATVPVGIAAAERTARSSPERIPSPASIPSPSPPQRGAKADPVPTLATQTKPPPPSTCRVDPDAIERNIRNLEARMLAEKDPVRQATYINELNRQRQLLKSCS